MHCAENKEPSWPGGKELARQHALYVSPTCVCTHTKYRQRQFSTWEQITPCKTCLILCHGSEFCHHPQWALGRETFLLVMAMEWAQHRCLMRASWTCRTPHCRIYSAQNITIMRLKSLPYLDVKRAFLAGSVPATPMLGRALSGCAQFHFGSVLGTCAKPLLHPGTT